MRLVKTILALSRACGRQQDLFEQVFPEGTKINPATLTVAHAAGIDTLWLYQFLSPTGQRAFMDWRATASPGPERADAILHATRADEDLPYAYRCDSSVPITAQHAKLLDLLGTFCIFPEIFDGDG